MILIEGNWEEVNDLQDAACLVRSYYNSDLADEIEKLTPIHTVLLRDDIKSEEFTIDDFKKWTESREHGLV